MVLAVGEAVRDPVGLIDGVADRDGVRVALPVAVAEPSEVIVAVTVAEGLLLGLRDGVAVAAKVGVRVALGSMGRVPVTVIVGVALRDGVAEMVGEGGGIVSVGVVVGASGLRVGVRVALAGGDAWSRVGEAVGVGCAGSSSSTTALISATEKMVSLLASAVGQEVELPKRMAIVSAISDASTMPSQLLSPASMG